MLVSDLWSLHLSLKKMSASMAVAQIQKWLLEKNLFGKECFKYKCPRCKALLSSDTKDYDQVETCPECGQKMRLPNLERLERRRIKQGFNKDLEEPIAEVVEVLADEDSVATETELKESFNEDEIFEESLMVENGNLDPYADRDKAFQLYPGLRNLSGFYRFLGWVATIFAWFFAIVWVVNDFFYEIEPGLGAAIVGYVFPLAVTGLFLLAIPEIILIVIRLERNLAGIRDELGKR